MTGRPDTGLPFVDPGWLKQTIEEILDPDLPIVDAHHHLWAVDGYAYSPSDLLADLGHGHKVEATILVQAGHAYRTTGPEALKPVGETEYAVAAARASNVPRLCTGIVGHADLRLGAEVDAVLEAHIQAGDGRFRGIRQNLAIDAAMTRHLLPPPPPNLAADPAFRRGFARLRHYDLSFDAWLFHPQLPELIDLAESFPDTPIVLDHFGGVLGIGPYQGRRDEIFQEWRRNMRALAAAPNVYVKLGGLGLSASGLDLHLRPVPTSSIELAALWRPYIEFCIENFGVERCMFESNFPVDKAVCSYPVIWNTFKLLAAGASADEKAALFRGTARRFYRI